MKRMTDSVRTCVFFNASLLSSSVVVLFSVHCQCQPIMNTDRFGVFFSSEILRKDTDPWHAKLFLFIQATSCFVDSWMNSGERKWVQEKLCFSGKSSNRISSIYSAIAFLCFVFSHCEGRIF